MRPKIELSHLKYFYFTALEGGVSQAAARLCVQQPVVSKMIKTLEQQLNQRLFRKTGRKNSLTDFGQLIFRHCQTIFEELEKVERLEFKDEKDPGVFSIGASEAVISHRLAPLIGQLSESFPSTNFNVYSSTAAHLLEMISEGALDLGIFFHVPRLADNLEVILTVPTRFRVVIQTLKKSDPKVIQTFIGSREIDDLGNHKFPTVDLIRKSYPKTRIVYSSNHFGWHRQMVLQGKGISILPDFLVAKDLESRALTDFFPRKHFVFDLLAVSRKGIPKGPILQSVLRGLKSHSS